MANMSNRQSYLAEQDANKKSRQAAGLVSDKFPNVEGMVIDMVNYQNLSNPILMYRKLNVFPASYAYFKMDCMIKECEDGFFDLGPVIKEMVKGRKKAGKGSMKCKGGVNRKELGPDHASIDYDIEIKYYTAAEARRIQAELAATKAAKESEPVKPVKPAKPQRPEPKAVQEHPKRKKALKEAARAASKKAAAKKAAPKKAAPKKAAPKKAAPKKAAPKKAAPKKAAPKKAAPKKTAPKKKAARR